MSKNYGIAFRFSFDQCFKLCSKFNDRKSRQTTLKNRKTQLDQHQKYKESAFRFDSDLYFRKFPYKPSYCTLLIQTLMYKYAFRSKQEDKLNEAVTKFTEDQKKAVAETERAALLQRQEKIEKVR